jgi:hypothetical protein
MSEHDALVEDIRVQVGPIRPRDGTPIGNDTNFGEAGWVTQTGEHSAEIEELAEVEFPG